jgi:hypothetical protein
LNEGKQKKAVLRRLENGLRIFFYHDDRTAEHFQLSNVYLLESNRLNILNYSRIRSECSEINKLNVNKLKFMLIFIMAGKYNVFIEYIFSSQFIFSKTN